MFCEENEIETNFLNSVELFDSYKIGGHKLYLKTKLNLELVFVAEDWY
jgi:hypothetical protein